MKTYIHPFICMEMLYYHKLLLLEDCQLRYPQYTAGDAVIRLLSVTYNNATS